MLTVYFITILTLTTNTISEGWLQWSKPYTSKPECELIVMKEKDQFIDGIEVYLKNKFVKVKNIECMTHAEAVKRNTILGH